jgi:divalent metal cation (Fe/Co/Zn/Cd) transporter
MSVRVVAVVLGILIALAGSVWALQGVGLILGSFMSNDPLWIWIGAGTAIAGLALFYFGLRSTPAKHT